MLVFSGCSDADEPATPSQGDGLTPQIIFLFSPGGLGDMSYNDCILEGVQGFKRSHPEVDVFLYSPASMEEADRIFSDWMKRPGSDIPVVFCLASSDFEPLVDLYTAEYSLTPNKRILLFESLRQYPDDKISTFQVSMYGASYLAGVSASQSLNARNALILLGSSEDEPIESARDGFIEGYGGKSYEVEYLASDWSGYVMANLTYQRMSEWTGAYDFIFPVAGGSNTGIYRFARENPDAPWLAGMDVDQSELSDKITGSVVKRFDILINEYFTQWLHTGQMPPGQIYGLDSGYVDWQLAPLHAAALREAVDAARPLAIEKEKDYYELHP